MNPQRAMRDARDGVARDERIAQPRAAFDPREIGLDELEVAELPRERRAPGAGLAERDEPGRAAAQAMSRRGCRARRVARTDELEQRALLERARGQHLKTRGLHDDEHVLVLERDVE